MERLARRPDICKCCGRSHDHRDFSEQPSVEQRRRAFRQFVSVTHDTRDAAFFVRGCQHAARLRTDDSECLFCRSTSRTYLFDVYPAPGYVYRDVACRRCVEAMAEYVCCMHALVVVGYDPRNVHDRRRRSKIAVLSPDDEWSRILRASIESNGGADR